MSGVVDGGGPSGSEALIMIMIANEYDIRVLLSTPIYPCNLVADRMPCVMWRILYE